VKAVKTIDEIMPSIILKAIWLIRNDIILQESVVLGQVLARTMIFDFKGRAYQHRASRAGKNTQTFPYHLKQCCAGIQKTKNSVSSISKLFLTTKNKGITTFFGSITTLTF